MNHVKLNPLNRRTPEWHLVSVLYASESVLAPTGEMITQECIYLVKAATAIGATGISGEFLGWRKI